MNTTTLHSLSKSLISEVQLRYQLSTPYAAMPKISCSEEAYKILKEIWKEFDNIDYVESFVILLVNRANKVLGWYRTAIGGVNGVVCDPKIIYQAALLSNASGIILSHNHPSGQKKPSEADKLLTQKIKAGDQYLDLSILDHIILTREDYFSFADDGIL